MLLGKTVVLTAAAPPEVGLPTTRPSFISLTSDVKRFAAL